MIAWTVPGAVAGLLLLAGPIVAHLLLRRRAPRVIFPTTRFLQSTSAAAVRLRSPSDLGLMILRAAIVLAAVLAAAQPVLLAAWRTGRWNARVARAVVLDTSRSMPMSGEGSRLAQLESHAFATARFDADDLEDALQRAAAWLARTPPARREIVIISDFQRGAIDRNALGAVPADIGIRFIRAGTPSATGSGALPAIAGWRGSRWQPALVLHGESLDVAWTRVGVSNESWVATSAIPVEAEAASRALTAALSLGIPSGDDGRRARVVFKGVSSSSGETEVRTAWMQRAVVTLGQSSLLREARASVEPFEDHGVLVLRTDVSAAAAGAPAVVRAAMLAVKPEQIADREMETAAITDAQLNEWRRDAAPVAGRPRVLVGDGIESRWLWAVALALLGIESWLRRQRSASTLEEARADAA